MVTANIFAFSKNAPKLAETKIRKGLPQNKMTAFFHLLTFCVHSTNIAIYGRNSDFK